jgi:bromodomain adjacent to zinc finger domain protein 1A
MMNAENQDGDITDAIPEIVLGISSHPLFNALAEVGNSWERVPLRASEGRDGWQDALVGCLKDVSLHQQSLVRRFI